MGSLNPDRISQRNRNIRNSGFYLTSKVLEVVTLKDDDTFRMELAKMFFGAPIATLAFFADIPNGVRVFLKDLLSSRSKV